jgi:polysaccharide export outer membrane protein
MQPPGKPVLFLSACTSLLLALAGCSSLPGSGPSRSDIVNQQTSAIQGLQYTVIDIDAATVEALRRRGSLGFYAQFGDRRFSAEPVVGVGDTLTVTIWEAAPGGLFSPQAGASITANAVSTGANSASIPEQTVGRDGGITVPYAGRIHVVGKTTREIQREIEQALEGKAIQPQALVNVVKPNAESVSVGGEVAAGARVPLSPRGDRLLEVIDQAGGVKSPVNETWVELSRGPKTTRMPLTAIVASPREDIYLHPNDIVTLVHDPQKFIAYGATGQNAEITFDADGISLAEAISKAGGLLDWRADPRGVFIFRYEIEPVARRLRPDIPLFRSAGLTPVVYRLDLVSPDGLFLAQHFSVANRDIVYVSNSSSTELQKVFGIIAGGIGTIGAGASIYGVAK